MKQSKQAHTNKFCLYEKSGVVGMAGSISDFVGDGASNSKKFYEKDNSLIYKEDGTGLCSFHFEDVDNVSYNTFEEVPEDKREGLKAVPDETIIVSWSEIYNNTYSGNSVKEIENG